MHKIHQPLSDWARLKTKEAHFHVTSSRRRIADAGPLMEQSWSVMDRTKVTLDQTAAIIAKGKDATRA
jgi:hypothetical protein